MPQVKKQDDRSVLTITRERLQDTLDDAVRRGRMTRDDASRSAGRDPAARVSAPAGVVRLVTGGGEDAFPIEDYDDLTAAQVVSQLGDLDAAGAAPRARLRAPQREPQDGAGGGRAEARLVPRADGLGERVELGEVLGGELQVRRGGVLLQPRAPLRARDRDDVVALREQPGERDLRRRRVAPLGDAPSPSRPAPGWRPSPRGWKRGLFLRKSPGGNVCGCELAGQEAAAERRERQERGAVGGAPRHDLGERVARPQRAPRTARRRPGGSRARARSRSTLTSDRPSAPTLPCCDQLGHRAPGLLERHLGVDAVELVEVDEVGAQALAASPRSTRARAPGGRPWRITYSSASSTTSAALGGEHDLVAAACDRPADELLVRVRAVHVGRVEQRHADVERAVDDRDRLRARRARSAP